MTRRNRISTLRRWLRFNVVGLIGVLVQIGTLQLLVNRGLDYRFATMLAVEAAVLNNFVWHLRYTWSDRRSTSAADGVRRLLTFHITNGAVSLAATWTLMALLVARAGFPVLAANVICILACSIVNFLMAELVVFSTRPNRRRKPCRVPQPSSA